MTLNPSVLRLKFTYNAHARTAHIPPCVICHVIYSLKVQAKDAEPSIPGSDLTSSFDIPNTSPSKPSSQRFKTEGALCKRKKSSRRARRKKSIKDDDRISKHFIVSLA